jgi:16S rRNA (guanine966-N2)-methyltransferase
VAWYAITGGPCSGKTTLAEALARRGHAVVAEAARAVLAEAIAAGGSAAQVRADDLAFHREVVGRTLVALERASPARPTFFDRTIYDSIAYSRLHGWPVGEELRRAARRRPLRHAFLLDLLPWQADGVRVESADFATALDPLLEATYRQYGVPVTRVAVVAPEARVELVLAFDGTRPITDRAKEALFSILMPRLRRGPFLDLFAGTGGVGIEALSRGVERATFVELNRAAIGDLRANLSCTRLIEGATVVHGDVFGFLRGTPVPHAVVFVSPPQWRGLWLAAMRALDASPGWVDHDGVVVVQCDPRELAAQEVALAFYAPR